MGAVMPAAPVVAPPAADDMTGSVGFGVGVSAGTSLVVPNTTSVMMKYWMSDAMSLLPRLSLTMEKIKDGGDTAWTFEPAVLANFVLLKGASTRFDAGLGLGLSLAKNTTPQYTGATGSAFVGDPTATYIGLFIPVQLGVEHFFTRWFSMGIAAGFNLVGFQKQGDPYQFDLEISNVRYMGSLFFYTD